MARHSTKTKRTTAKHRLGAERSQPGRRRMVEMVDARTDTAHFLTVDAATDGYRADTYLAMCGEDVLPAALVASAARYCRLCAPLPTQRSRRSR